jgi:hypothetical protein
MSSNPHNKLLILALQEELDSTAPSHESGRMTSLECTNPRAVSNQQSKINNRKSKMLLSPSTATRRLDPNPFALA